MLSFDEVADLEFVKTCIDTYLYVGDMTLDADRLIAPWT